MPDLLALNGQIIGGVPLPGDNYKKIWENPDPTAAFAAQNITLSSDDYDFLLIDVTEYKNANHDNGFIIKKETSGGGVLHYGITDGSKAVTLQRTITFNNFTSLAISDCSLADASTVSTSNDHCIPRAVYAIKKDALATEGGGVGGGHIIEDADGTDLDQQDTLQFKGTLRATNDSQNGKTVVDDSAVEIEWDVWQDMTQAQRDVYLAEHPKVDVVGFPDANADLELELMTKLWENTDPTQTFGAQTITLDSSDYDFLYIEAMVDITSSFIVSETFEKGKGCYISYTDSTNTVWYRFASFTSATQITFTDGKQAAATSNGVIIPIAIYGFKKKITVGIDAIAEDVSTSASKCMMEDGETSVEDKIQEIESVENIVSYFTGVSRAVKYGHVIEVNGNAPKAGGSIGTVSAPYIPISMVVGSGNAVTVGDGSKWARIVIDTNGNIGCTVSSTFTYNIPFSLIYII